MYSLANFLKTFNIILTLPLVWLDGLFDIFDMLIHALYVGLFRIKNWLF